MLDQVGVVGLEATGLHIAANLVQHGRYTVKGYDVRPNAVAAFVSRVGRAGLSYRDVARDSSWLICTAAAAEQVDDMLFNAETGALEGK